MSEEQGDTASAVKRFGADVVRGIAVDLTARAIIFVAISLLCALALLVVAGGTVPPGWPRLQC